MKKFSRKFSLEPRVDYSMSVATELERQLSHVRTVFQVVTKRLFD